MSTSTSPGSAAIDPKSAEHAEVILNSLFKVFQNEITAAINANLQSYPFNDESKRNKDIRASREPSKDKSKQQQTEVHDHPHLKHWLHFPKDISFFGEIVQSISHVAQYNFEALFSLLLAWLPQRAIKDSEELLSALDTESWCSFTTFVQGIKGFRLSDQRTLDLMEIVVVFTISELLMRLLNTRTVMQQLTAPALNKLFHLAVNFFKPMTPRAMESGAWSALNQSVLENWIKICGHISPFVLPQISEYLAKTVIKLGAEQQNSVLHGLSAIKLNVTSSELSEESKNIVSRVLPFIILKDKNTLRAGPLEVLDSALVSIDFSNNPVIDEKARAAYKFLHKLNEKGDDSAVEGPALRLMATILAHGPREYYYKHAYSFISKTLLKGAFNPKKKDACLEAILRLLQGRHVPGADSPYTYLPFMEMDKHKDKLLSISEGLFGQKTPLPRVNESLDLCAEILLQIGAHVGVKTLQEGPLAELLNSPHHAHVLLALRVTRRLTLPDLPLKAPRDTLEALSRALSKISRALGELNADCPNRVDLAPLTLVDSALLTRVIDETVDQNIPLDTSISAQEERTLRDKFKTMQSRLKRYATTSSEELESEEEKALYKIDQFVQDRIKVWSSVVNELTANSYTQSIFEEFDQNDEARTMTKRTIFHKPAAKKRVTTPERSVQHELFKEMITCLETQLPDEQTLQLALLPDEKMMLQVPGEEGSFIGRYLLHTDDEVSTVCAHFLQRVVITQPSLRVSVIKAMCAQVLQLSESAEQQHHNIRSALHHLLLLVDLWVFALIRANTREGVPAVPLSLILKLERVALIMMSHWSAAVRGVALDLVHSAQCLATLAVQHSGPDRAHIVTRRLAWVFDRHTAQIVQNARWHFFLYLTNGIDRDVKMNHTAAIQLTLTHIARSTQDLLWSQVLSEIGRLCVQYEFQQLLTKLRQVLQTRLKALSAVLNESADAVLLPVIIARNYRTLYMATSTPDLDIVRRADKPATPRGEESARSELSAYLEECWKLLLKDNALVTHTVQYSLGCVNPLSWGTVLDSMWRWYASIKRGDSKKRNKARGSVVNILRTLATYRQFRQFVTDNDKAVAVCAELLKDLPPLLDELNKTSSLFAGPLVLDHLLLLVHYVRAVAMENQCCKRGPLRWYLETGATKPAVLQILAGPDRYQLYQQLIRWCGTGKAAQSRVALDQGEATRLLNKIKDSARRDSKKVKYERVVRAVQATAAQAIEQLFRLESLLPPSDLRTVRKLILDWMLPAEIVHGTRILRWMMSIYFEETFPLFIDKCYSESVKESIYFINAVYDQFLPVKVSPPHNGIADDVRIYFSEYLVHKQRRTTLETSSMGALDKTFTAQISAHAGALLYLALYNLVHQSSVLRTRSFKLLVRLVPVAFGLLNPHNELEASYTRDKLLLHKTPFSSKVEDTSKKSALDVVAVASKQCQLFTEDLFAEIFTRFKSVSIEGKCWTLQCMLPWLDNVVLQDDVTKKPGSLKRYSTSEFLEQMFTYMTVLLTLRPDTSELFVQLWHRLAKTATNISPVVSFLLKRGLGNKGHLEICKSIILSLYKVNAPATLKQIIPHLSVKGIIDFILTSNTPPMLSTTDEVPAVRNSPGPSRQSPVKPILGLARQLSLLWPQRATSPSKYDKFNKVPPINVNVAPGSPSRNKNREVSFQIREVSVALLTDFATENIAPLLSHVHIIFNYAILRMDSNEAHNLSRLLYVILIAIKRTFKADKKLADLPCLASLDNLVRLLKTVSFKLKWNFKSTGPEAAPSTDPNTNQLLDWATNAIDVATLIQLLIECCQPIEPQVQKYWADEALNWAIEYKDLGLSTKSFEMYKNVTSNANGAKVIEDKISRTTIKRLVRVLDETLRGLDEAFSTLSSISVNARHTKAPQSPRSDAAADAVEPQGPPSESALPLSDPTNNATDKSTPRFTLASSTTGAPLAAQGPLSSNSAGSDSLSSPRGRRSSGSSNLPLPSFRETPATPTSANNSAANSGTVTPSGRDSSESARTPIDATAAQYRRLQHLAEDNIQILTARAVEILTTLQKISAILRNEEYLLYLFWTAHAMLKLAPLRLPRVYEEALRLLSVLLQNTVLRPVLESAADSAVYQQLRERTALVDVTCLQELVLPGLYLSQTELLAAAVLSELNSSRCELVANTKARHVLWMLSFVPWLDAHLLHSDLRIKITPSLDHVIAALESSPGHFTTIADILQRYQAGNFDQNPALFLELIGSELYSIGFVPHAREVINLIAILCNYAPKSAWRLARLFASQPHAAKHAPDFRALVQEAAHRLSQGDQSAASFINELAGLLDRAASNKLVFAPSVLDWTPHVELGDPRTNHVITCLRVVSTLIEEQSKHRKESKEKRRAAVRVNAPKDKPSKDKTPRHHVRAKSTMVATSPRRTRDKDGTIRDKPRDKKDDRMSLSLVQVTTTPREGPKSASTSPRAVEPLKISIGNESEDSDDLDFDLSLAEDLIGDDDKLESLKKQLQMNFGEDTLVEVREDDEDEDEDSMDSFDLDMEGADDAFFKAFDLEEKESSKLDDDFNSLMSSLNNPVLTSPDDDLAALPSLPYEVDSIQKALNGLKLLESNDSTSSTTDPRNSNKTDSGISTPSSMPSTPTTAPSSPFSPAPAIDTATQLSDIFDRAQVRRVFKSFVEKNNLDKNLVDLAEALYDYRNNIISSSSSMSTKAKLIMQRFFPKSSSVSGSSSIPEALKRETIKAYEAALLSGKFSKSLFEKIESITTQILNRDYFPQFVKSDMFAQITHQN